MEPQEFCEKWLSLSPNTPGYRTECVRFLEQNLQEQYSFDTINDGWGSGFKNRPNRVLPLLKTMDTLYETQAQLRILEEQLRLSLALIENFLKSNN